MRWIIISLLLFNQTAFADIPKADALKAILGEARGETYAGKVAIGEALRHREKLPYYKKVGVMNGVYGYSATDYTVDPLTRLQAERAWQESSKTNHVKGAQYWFSESDMKAVMGRRWFKKLTFVTKIGGHYFYREDVK